MTENNQQIIITTYSTCTYAHVTIKTKITNAVEAFTKRLMQTPTGLHTPLIANSIVLCSWRKTFEQLLLRTRPRWQQDIQLTRQSNSGRQWCRPAAHLTSAKPQHLANNRKWQKEGGRIGLWNHVHLKQTLSIKAAVWIIKSHKTRWEEEVWSKWQIVLISHGVCQPDRALGNRLRNKDQKEKRWALTTQESWNIDENLVEALITGDTEEHRVS